jgi:hypothetical protein
MNLACLDILGTYRNWAQSVMAAPEIISCVTSEEARKEVSVRRYLRNLKMTAEPTACHRA